MKRNNLTTAVIAGIVGVAGMMNMAGAVDLNPDGLGQVLIYPYYTVNQGNQTLMSVVNTTGLGKAVKVRFLEGYDSREVLDFNLYLSPNDVWTADIFDNGNPAGPGNLTTSDNSCTVPTINAGTGAPAAGLPTLASGATFVPFSNVAYSSPGTYGQTDESTDGGPTDLARTREGYIELIEMGTVNNNTDNSLTAITHVDGQPPGCSQINEAWAPGGYWSNNAVTDMAIPSGGLFGSGAIINNENGYVAGYDADAVDGFSVNILHTNPGSLAPNLDDAAYPVPGEAVSYVFETPGRLITSTYPGAAGSRLVDAVSSVFDASDVYNEYVTDPGIGASSEWVVTFPTKRFYVDPFIVGTTAAVPPFEQVFSKVYPGKSCFQIGLNYYNREEAHPTGTVIFSPPPPTGTTTLCYETQVITFDQSGGTSTILGSNLVSNVDVSPYTSGWMDLDLDSVAGHALIASTEGNVFNGLPATGFLVSNYINSQAQPGILANYAALFRHRIARNCSNDDNNGACS